MKSVKEICKATVYSITAEIDAIERIETSIEAIKTDKRYRAEGREKRLGMLEKSKEAHEKSIVFALTNVASMLEGANNA